MTSQFGYIDLEQRTLQPIDKPLGTRLSSCLRYKPLPMSPGWTIRRLAEEVGFDSCLRSKQIKKSKNRLLHSMLRASQTVRTRARPFPKMLVVNLSSEATEQCTVPFAKALRE